MVTPIVEFVDVPPPIDKTFEEAVASPVVMLVLPDPVAVLAESVAAGVMVGVGIADGVEGVDITLD